MKRLILFLIITSLVIAPAATSSIDNVTWVQNKAYLKYEGRLLFLGNISYIRIFEFKNYTEISPNTYNLTFYERFYAFGSRNNETTHYVWEFDKYVFVNATGAEDNLLRLYDNARHSEAVNIIKSEAQDEGFSNLNVYEDRRAVGDKKFSATIIEGSATNATFKAVLGKNIGVVLYFYYYNGTAGVGMLMNLTDTNLEESALGAIGGMSSTTLIAIISIIIVVALILFLFLRKKSEA